jgi:hypothetical protein
MQYPSDLKPPPKSGSSKKIILIVAIAAVVLCCLCPLLAGAGAAVYQFLLKDGGEPNIIAPQPFTDLPTLLPGVPTLPVTAATPLPTVSGADIEDQPDAPSSSNGLGTRQELMDFYNAGEAFVFEDPINVGDLELVTGYHTWVCLKNDCAAVTMAGPAEEILSLAIVVPTDKKDAAQTATAVTLLMNTAMHFAGEKSDLPFTIMSDILDAQSKDMQLEKTTTENGFTFTETYDPATGQGGLLVVRSSE